jgi:hypothetical protein
MKGLYDFLKQELASVVLILVSFIPLFFIGSLLDILLTHFYANIENGKAGLPVISQWVYGSLAGHRFLPQEIMACFWALMVILFILNAFFCQRPAAVPYAIHLFVPFYLGLGHDHRNLDRLRMRFVF